MEERSKAIIVLIDDVEVEVPAGVTVRKALELSGLKPVKHPDDEGIFMPCEVGGCYACRVIMDGEAVRACVTPVRDGAKIRSRPTEDYVPLRIIHGPSPHSVGGKATPWWLKFGAYYIEVAIWAAGCNLRCPQCQNYSVTYDGKSRPMKPEDAARVVSEARRKWGVDRMAISGGEPTLNRKWLIRYFRELKRLNPDRDARLHLDSNGTILTKDYIDELILEGVTDIGVEPKGLTPETFMKITGIGDKGLAEKYLNTAWEAIKYIRDRYLEKVFLGVGLPYNRAFIDMQEVYRFGERLASIDPEIQICVLDYFPTFRRTDIERPRPREMLKVKRVLEGIGLKAVVVQTSVGHFGPKDRV
jgi:pyruvate formate lyase activating enzyme